VDVFLFTFTRKGSRDERRRWMRWMKEARKDETWPLSSSSSSSPAGRSLARPSVRRSASPILACKLRTSPRISCGVVRRPADSLRPTSLGPFPNSIADYAQSGRCLQQQATSVSVLVVLHVLPVGQQLRTVASSSRIHWRASCSLPGLGFRFGLWSPLPYFLQVLLSFAIFLTFHQDWD
jgi:hypothetical protein